jgi:hypothetical protein
MAFPGAVPAPASFNCGRQYHVGRKVTTGKVQSGGVDVDFLYDWLEKAMPHD